MTRKIYCLGNWKMNQTIAEINKFDEEFSHIQLPLHINIGIAPQTLHLIYLKKNLATPILIGAQNCFDQSFGAFTGENSVESLKEAEIDFTLIGHSERRQLFKESNEWLKSKLFFCLKNEFKAVFCIGETLEQFEAGKTMEVLKTQLSESVFPVLNEFGVTENIVIAYEPVWAIGTGKTATVEIITETLGGLRGLLKEAISGAEQISLLYGGSVKPENSDEIAAIEDVDGVLVGGASLKPESFAKIINSFAEQKNSR